MYTQIPWWMPDLFFKNVIIEERKNWIEKRRGLIRKSKIYAPKDYFGNEENIEDTTEDGYKAFEKMRKNAE